MPARQSLSKRWSTAARWPVGVALTSWRYLWRTTATHRWELAGGWPDDAPPALPEEVDRDAIQGLGDGVGPLVHRIYRTRIVGSAMSAEGLMRTISEDINCVAPAEFATFQKTEGERGDLQVGDTYVVRMPGPWDGPVRVVAVEATSFRLATLEGHLEAGQIEFRVRSDHRSLYFEIESWARSGDRLSDLLYTHLRISKEVQVHMWSSVLGRVVNLAGGTTEGGIVITTRLVEPEALPGGGRDETPAPVPPEVTELAARAVNFDTSRIDDYIADDGWHLDDMVEALPPEGSGPPEENGSWQVARSVMVDYQLADPRVVAAIHDRESPFAGRDMLLKIRFGALRLTVGVRIGDVYEETLELDGRRVHVFGWDYRTLEGHFEEGQLHYEIWKWLESGDVEFHLRAVSRPATSGPLWLRKGFRLFGRSRQLRFYRQACRRIRRLTEAELETSRVSIRTRGPQGRPASSG